jgi:hypothetical protein
MSKRKKLRDYEYKFWYSGTTFYSNYDINFKHKVAIINGIKQTYTHKISVDADPNFELNMPDDTIYLGIGTLDI